MVFGNMGDDSGHGRRVHPRPEHRRAGAVRRVPHQRPGRGRGGGHPAPRPGSPRCRPRCPRCTRSSSASASSWSGTTATSRTSSSPSSAASCTCSRPAPPSGPPRPPCASRRTWWRRASSPRRRPSRASSRRTSTSCCATSSTRARPGARQARRQGPQRVARAPPWVARCSTPTSRSSGSGGARRSCWCGSRRQPDDFHGMAVAQGILTARGGATSHAAVVARQIGKPCVAGCAELVIDYGTRTCAQHRVRRSSFKRGRLDQPRWLHGRGLPGRDAHGGGPLRGADRPPADPGLGGRDPAHGRLDQRRQARGGRAGPGVRRPGHRPVPHRAHVPRGRPAGDRAGRHPRRQPGHPGQGDVATRARRWTPTRPRSSSAFDAAMAKLEVLQQGDFEGIFAAMDGLPVVIRLIDPPLHEFLPNLEEQLVKVTRAGDAATAEDQAAARDHPVDARAEPDAGPPRLPAGPDDPRLREDPDARHPERPDRGQAGRAATPSPRS